MVTRIPHAPARFRAFAIAACVLVSAGPALAAGPRARLSADLADHLAAGSQAVRVIVHGTKADVDAIATRYNLRVARYMASGGVLVVNAGQIAALRDDGSIDHLSGDIRIAPSVDQTTAETVGADQVWAGGEGMPGLTGAGVAVAVIDSGIDIRHRAFGRRVIVNKDFTGHDDPMDHYGHGTHVAGIIAGGGTMESGYRGIAPGAYLLNLRVLGDDGSGDASDVIEAIDWTVEHRKEFNVRVINLSLGAPVLQPYRDDPLCEAVERAVRAGITVVAAAGNYGRTADGKTVYGGIMSPANSPFAIAVGAVDTHGTAYRSDDTLAPYSSKGPTRYDLILKPDVAAPGHHIASAEASGSYLATRYTDRHVGGAAGAAVMQLSGTSMAAGVVSGATALLAERRANLAPLEIKASLQLGSTFMSTVGVIGAGAGEANVLTSMRVSGGRLHSIAAIGGEVQRHAWLPVSLATDLQSWSIRQISAASGSTGGDSIIWGSSIIWGASSVHGSLSLDRIRGSAVGDSIIWGSA
ncbi:MAG TPA: S8 family peptidase, partial [Vicinamibacterales bacterium]|nr:S8 family peptidase [Vicinamibacterales bacterium]